MAGPKKKSNKPSKKAVKKPVKKPIKRRPTTLKTPVMRLAPKPTMLAAPTPIPTTVSNSSDLDKLPWYYGDNRMVLMVRDPWWLFAYWEVTPELRARVEDEIRRSGAVADVTVLRVYDLSSGQHNSFDIELRDLADRWYIDVGKPDHEWVAEIGIRCHGGRYFALIRSNMVHTPRYGVSNVLDEEWLMPDELYMRILGMTGSSRGVSSLDMQEMFRRYLHDLKSSDRFSSESLAKQEP